MMALAILATYRRHSSGELRDHIGRLDGAVVTGFLTDNVTEAWIDFTYRCCRFSIAYQSGVDSEAGRHHVLVFKLEFERGRPKERIVLTWSTNGQMQLWDLAIDPVP